jgi:hypothetical protein
MTDMDAVTGRIYSGDPAENSHFIIQNQHSAISSSRSYELLMSWRRTAPFVWLLMHSSQAFIEPHNMFRSPLPGISSFPYTISLHSSRQNYSASGSSSACEGRCCGVLMMGSLASSHTNPPHSDRVTSEIHSGATVEHVRKCSWRSL